MKCKNYIYMQHLAGGGCKFMILHKASFFLEQRNKFIQLLPSFPLFEKLTPTQIPIKSIIINPNQIN